MSAITAVTSGLEYVERALLAGATSPDGRIGLEEFGARAVEQSRLDMPEFLDFARATAEHRGGNGVYTVAHDGMTGTIGRLLRHRADGLPADAVRASELLGVDVGGLRGVGRPEVIDHDPRVLGLIVNGHLHLL